MGRILLIMFHTLNHCFALATAIDESVQVASWQSVLLSYSWHVAGRFGHVPLCEMQTEVHACKRTEARVGCYEALAMAWPASPASLAGELTSRLQGNWRQLFSIASHRPCNM